MRTTPQHLATEYRASGAWSEQCIGDLFAESAAVEPARLAIADPPNRVALDGAVPRRLDWRSLSALVDATMVALADAGLRRDDVFITNIVKFRPPENRDPNEAEITACLPYLLAQIKVIQPKLIVFLGRHSMNVFFPELKISQAHGNVFRRQGHVFLPLYHPAAALYNGSMRTILLEDFAKIPVILEKITETK